MRSKLSATCIMATAMIAAVTSGRAQTAAAPIVTAPVVTAPVAAAPVAAAPSARSKPVAAVPARPALQAPADTANAMAQSDRLAIQSDLAWAGDYNGAINGEVSDRMVAAIKTFQKNNGGRETGVLNLQERGLLAAAAKKLQDNVGWRMVSDTATGARLGIPTKLVPQQTSDATGSRWSSSTGTIQITTSRRRDDAPSTAKLAATERQASARKVEYSVVKPDFFVLSGMQGQKKFYVRGQLRDTEVRVLTVLYDQATEGTMEPVVIAMSSAFTAFPAGAQAMGPPPRKKVEYASGIVVSDDGAIVTDRQAVEGCMSIVVAGYGNADKTAEDKTGDLALLRIYGARGLKPLALGTAGTAARPALDLVGIADPQNQGGASAVSRLKASAAPAAGNGEIALSPPPGLGFSGAAAIDVDGAFIGLAQLKPLLVAGPATAAAATQAVLVPADAVRGFAKTHGVAAPAAASNDATAAIVRVICVRK